MAQLFPIQAQKSTLFSGNRRGEIFFKKKKNQQQKTKSKKDKKNLKKKRISLVNRFKKMIFGHPHFQKQEYFFYYHP